MKLQLTGFVGPNEAIYWGGVNNYICHRGGRLGRLLVAALVMSICGCGSANTPLKVTAFTISPSNPTINYGAGIQFSLTFQPPGSVPSGVVLWTSSNPGIAFIRTQGYATSAGFADLAGFGPTTITAQVDGLKASTVLTVLPPPTIISILQNAPETFIGNTNPLSMLVLDVTSPDPIAQFLVTPDSWTSADPTVATISGSGLVTPIAPGISTLTATWNGAMASVILEVWGTPARFIYVANSASNNISGFQVSVLFDRLLSYGGYKGFDESYQPVPSSPVTAGRSPSALVADPLGKFLFVANVQSNNVSAYSIDPATGSLTPVPGAPFASGTGPVSLVVDISGKYLYVANSTDGSISGYSIDGGSGALAPLPGFTVATGSNPTAITADSDGFLYVVNSGSDSLSVFQMNAATGALIAVAGSPFSTGHQPSAVAQYLPGHFIYVPNQGSNSISGFTHDAAGNFTQLTGSPFPLYASPPSCPGDQPLGIAVDPQFPFAFLSFKRVLGTCNEIPTLTYQINTTSGMLQNVASSQSDINITGNIGPQPAVGVDSSGRYIYVLDPGRGAMINYRLGLTAGPSVTQVAIESLPNPIAVWVIK